MIFTSRGREFCGFAEKLRRSGYTGHVVAGGPFASFNSERLVREFPAFDSVALGEGEELMCRLAENLDSLQNVPGLCYRDGQGQAVTNPAVGNADRLDDLDPIFRAARCIARRQHHVRNRGNFATGYITRSIKRRGPHVPNRAGEQVCPMIRRRARNDSIVIFRITLRFH